jgi:mono/diheme cytochrome c family protein
MAREAFMLIAVSMAVTLLLHGAGGSATANAAPSLGERLAREKCGACHAIGRSGASPVPPAPPFRTLGSRFNIEGLPESLAEGISVGHPRMPQVIWEARDIEAFMAYLRTLQPTRPRAPR